MPRVVRSGPNTARLGWPAELRPPGNQARSRTTANLTLSRRPISTRSPSNSRVGGATR